MSKRQELREKRQRDAKVQRNMIIAGVAIVGLVIAAVLIAPTLQPVGNVSVPEAVSRPQVNFNGMGDPNAPVKIVEYSDFQCPYCARFSADTEPALIAAYVATGKVYFEYRTFGKFIGEESARAGEAAYCAGDQGKFWEMRDIIFANQTGENVGAYTDPRLVAFAKELNLDMANFNDCFNNGKHRGTVDQDGIDAFQEGIKATPSFTINGKLIEGAQPFDVFQKEIEAALAAAGQ